MVGIRLKFLGPERSDKFQTVTISVLRKIIHKNLIDATGKLIGSLFEA